MLAFCMCNFFEDSGVQGCYAMLSGEQLLFEVSCTAHAAYITLFLLSCTCSQICSDANSSFLLNKRCRTLKAVLQSCCGVMLTALIQKPERCMVAVVVDITWLFFVLTSVMCCWSTSLYLPVSYIIDIIDISH